MGRNLAPSPTKWGRVGEGARPTEGRLHRIPREGHSYRHYDFAMVSTNTHTSARRLRRESTDAERALWHALRRNALGAGFRRQHPIPPYFADFACVEARIVVEVDGGQHGGSQDTIRDAAMRAAGWRVLRFWNDEVLRNRAGVLTRIQEALAGGLETNG